MVFFEPESWWKYIYWLLKSSCFGFFGDEKYGLFCVKKLMERWNLLVTQKFLFWTFRSWEIRSFFSQKVDGKMIFTWSFWAFLDIAGLGKYGFSCSANSFYNLIFNLGGQMSPASIKDLFWRSIVTLYSIVSYIIVGPSQNFL